MSEPVIMLLQRRTHSLQMKTLLPTIRRGTPREACGAPATILSTSPLDLPQNEQRPLPVFTLAIIARLPQALLSRAAIRDARSLRR
jgi:hypothetical protein